MLLSVYFCSSTIKVMKNSGYNETMYTPYKDKDLVYPIHFISFFKIKRCYLGYVSWHSFFFSYC